MITRERATRLKQFSWLHLRLPTASSTSTLKLWDAWVKEKKTFINGLICVTLVVEIDLSRQNLAPFFSPVRAPQIFHEPAGSFFT